MFKQLIQGSTKMLLNLRLEEYFGESEIKEKRREG